MSSDLERRMRRLGEMLRDPSEAVTRRAHDRALAAARSRGRRRAVRKRSIAPLLAALLAATGVGVGIGALIGPQGTAASSPTGLGFLPERGWSVLQTAKKATLTQEAIAIAANVPISPDDAADRLPYSTMLSLPPNGVVILAGFTARGDELRDQHYPVRALPLRLRDAVPGSLQLRPKRPLGQYRLHAAVNGHNVDVTVYFGTPRPAPGTVTAAQRQLDRLVVRPMRTVNRVEERALPMRRAGISQIARPVEATSRVIDRTFRCTPVPLNGGLRELDVVAKPRGTHGRSPYARDLSTGYISVSSGPLLGAGSDLVYASSRLEQRTQNSPLPPGVYANVRRCARARVSVPLSPRGLPRPAVKFDEATGCEIRGRILVRVRAVLEAPSPWRGANPPYFGTQRNVVEAKIAVRSERTRRPIGFLELDQAGETRLWASSDCS